MEQILSQEEVDALLQGISGGVIEEPEEALDGDDLGYSRYDFTRLGRIGRTKMPALEAVNDAFQRAIRQSLTSALRRLVEITSYPAEFEQFEIFAGMLPAPNCLQIFRMDPFPGHALMAIEPAVAFTLIESFLGGSNERAVPNHGREFTNIEQRLILRVVNLLLKDLEKAWLSVQPIRVNHSRSETNPQFARICEPQDIVIINRFDLTGDLPVGSLFTCVPLTNLEPVRKKLMIGRQPEAQEKNPLHRRLISENILDVPIDLTVELGRARLPAGAILSLDQGDLIQLNSRPGDLLPAYVAGVPKYRGAPGRCRGNMAFCVKEKAGETDQK
jgi:flagellar motor switch protein FliM